MNRFNQLLLAAALVVSGISTCFAQQATPAAAKPASTAASGAVAGVPTQATLNEFLKKMFGWNSDLTWKVVEIKPAEAAGLSAATVVFNTPQGSQVIRFYITADQKYAFTGDLIPFGADPFAPARELLKNLSGPSRGPQDSTVTVVEFGDLECPACKAAQANITHLLSDEPKMRLVFQNFPLEQIHKWSLIAAKYLDCMQREPDDAVWKFIATVYDHQGEINEQNADQMLKGYVKEAGGNPDTVAACVVKPETEKRVRESLALGEKLEVTSTPTLFINGRRMVGVATVPYDALKEMVEYYGSGADK